MNTETWLALCGAELQHLYSINMRSAGDDVPSDKWGMVTAGELIKSEAYRGLDPVQAARTFWRDNE